MPPKSIAGPSRLGVAARIATFVLGSIAMAAPGCSDSTAQPKDTVPGTPDGASIAPGGGVKSNAKPSTKPSKAEPL